jgi:hypothetical protein
MRERVYYAIEENNSSDCWIAFVSIIYSYERLNGSQAT